MSNPFLAKFDSSCTCGEALYERDDLVYACDGQFVCQDCARQNGNVCECDEANYKKSEFEKCYDCFNEDV